MVIGNVEPGESGVDIVQAFVRSEVRKLLLECSPQLPNSELWHTSVQPMLDESYQAEKAELKAASVGTFHSVNGGRILLRSRGPYQTWGGVMAADNVGPKKYGELCPWLHGRGLTGRRTAAGSCVSRLGRNERSWPPPLRRVSLKLRRNSTRGGGGWRGLPTPAPP